MGNLKKRAMMLSKNLPDYVKEGLVLWLDGEESVMSLTEEDGTSIRIWCDRAVSGQKANIGGVTQSEDAVVFDGVNGRGKLMDTEYINLTGILSGLQDRTVEIVCKLNDTDSVQTVFLGKGMTASAEIGAAGLWYRPASGGFKVGTWDESPSVPISNVTERASYSIVYGIDSLTDFMFYQNGVECPKGAAEGNMYTTMTSIGARLKTDNETWQYRLNGEICCIRVYYRKLTDAERAHNLEIDKRRFNLNVG